MSPALWTILSLIAYAGGMVMIVKVTPRLSKLSFDEGMFMVVAAADVFGGILVFGAVGATFGIFNGVFGIRLLDFFLLIGIIVIGVRLSLRNFRPRSTGGTFPISRILAGIFSLFLVVAAFYLLVWLFLPSS